MNIEDCWKGHATRQSTSVAGLLDKAWPTTWELLSASQVPTSTALTRDGPSTTPSPSCVAVFLAGTSSAWGSLFNLEMKIPSPFLLVEGSVVSRSLTNSCLVFKCSYV